ncbi:SpoIIE family protein phosphatase [Desulfosporosinus sp. OT]|uniref:SpoIIE family protein phosphatase n=1 Tax=Desulfosporosinus sp. OT TaxID=913865 RepID=UPI000223A682|nr:SpoIIE family protein phosphatase [Desulfosporosinus sp. OT]EGW36405.1 stage II sporulation E family protein [Desulfosporosinus sp. OT]
MDFGELNWNAILNLQNIELQILKLERGGVNSTFMKRSEWSKYEKIINKGTMNVIVFASFVIIIAIVVTGSSNYAMVKRSLTEKLQKEDLVYILKSISTQVDARINRAKDTSLIIADSPDIIKWFNDGETDKQYEAMFLQQMTGLAKTFNYTVFFTNKKTGHYWTDSNLLTDTMSKDDPTDRWFFDAIRSDQKITLNIDHNKELNQTNLWVNTLMGDSHNPAGVAGVGVDLQDISTEFNHYKIGDKSNLWLVDTKGKISISEDVEQSGGKLSDYLPEDVYDKIMSDSAQNTIQPTIVSYADKTGKVDLIFQKLSSCDWVLVFQINRSETLGVLNSIMISTLVTIAVVLVLLLLVFYLVSSRIANPYKSAIQLNLELENEISERTAKISDQNTKILESLHYAQTIQESILPGSDVWNRVLADNFVLWKPRDIVGGDFYWLKETKQGFILVVGDCTGHGVPGALMTMAVNSILNNIVVESDVISPALVIRELNRQLREALNKEMKDHSTDDGLEAGICYYENMGKLFFAGAKINLYVSSADQIAKYDGCRSGIGYIKSTFSSEFKDVELKVEPGDRFYLTTDGYLDQNGGLNDYSFGKSRFMEIITRTSSLSMREQGAYYESELTDYMGQAPQRDDITVVGFQIK